MRNRWPAVALSLALWALNSDVLVNTAAQDTPPLTLVEQRQRFQNQELMPASSGGWVIAPGARPRIIWRDVDEVRRLQGDTKFQVRWFDADLHEFPQPEHPGRWIAALTGTAPNGTPFRRALTFFVVPPDIMQGTGSDLTVDFPGFPGPHAPAALREHRHELLRLGKSLLTRSLIDSEQGAILLAGLLTAPPLGRPARYAESASVLNDEHHLQLKLKLLELQPRVRTLRPPRPLETPATVLREGSADEAGVVPDARDRINAVCQAWADDTQEPFVTLVARRGVIITHQAFGRDAQDQRIPLDYRCWVASLTKTVTALMFLQFVDQGLIDLDARLSAVFPDFPPDDPHVPTFRQCLSHTSGLTGHGEFGGMKNPHLENIVLNAIDVNEPGSRYQYCGLGFELTAKAMEIVSGKAAARIYDEHLFQPLGFGDVVLGNASSDAELTALELGILAQWVANQGRYGAHEFISPTTFRQLLPQPVQVADRGYTEDEGLGLHWIRHRRAGAAQNSKQPADLLFGPRTLGHGSFSSCVFVVDPDQQLIITQARRQSGPRHAEWSPKFFQTIADVLVDDDADAPAGTQPP